MKKLVVTILFLIGFALSGCGSSSSSGGGGDKISSVPTDLGIARPSSLE